MEPLTHKYPYRGKAMARRALFFGLTFATAALAGTLMYDILRTNGLTGLETAGLTLFAVLFTWIAGSFWTAVIGFIVRLTGRDSALLSVNAMSPGPLRGRTAVLMPIYNEDVERVAAGIDAVWRSIQAQAEQGAFDFFILSDTRKPDAVAAEESMWRTLVRAHNAEGRIFFRHRADNRGRKAGNIADFVRSWGGAYEYMIILDADSVMTGGTLVKLARLMDAHPRVGILQTLPLLAGRETLFARLLQFATRLNGPMLASGLAYWQLGEGNYWGHNAIMRVKAFAEHCSLPRLPGREPLGGEVLSHDFVEAAFMRAGGYEVRMAPDLEGSWEDMPSNPIDYAARDRRWTQGNLQHMRILTLPGLHWLSRIHLLTGIMAYVTAPAWFGVLILSSVLVCAEAIQGPRYFEPGTHALFPQWPEFRPAEIAMLLTLTIIVLMLPKIMGAILAFKDRRLRHGFGGAGRLSISLLLEQVFSILLAPSMMIFHSMFVLQTLAGRCVNWNSQERGNRGLTLREVFVRYKWHTVLGLIWGAAIVMIAPKFIAWMAPVLAGLLLSIPLAWITSRADLGRRSRELRLFLTPEETTTPRELASLSEFSLQALGAADAGMVALTNVPARAPLRMEPKRFARFERTSGSDRLTPVRMKQGK